MPQSFDPWLSQGLQASHSPSPAKQTWPAKGKHCHKMLSHKWLIIQVRTVLIAKTHTSAKYSLGPNVSLHLNNKEILNFA